MGLPEKAAILHNPAFPAVVAAVNAALVGKAVNPARTVRIGHDPADIAAAVEIETLPAAGKFRRRGGCIDRQTTHQAGTGKEESVFHLVGTLSLFRIGVAGSRVVVVAGIPSVVQPLIHGHGGLAFQVVDDILDVTADTAVLGKTAGKDLAADKPTYVSLLGLEQARALASQCEERALGALERIENCSDIEKTTCRRLRELARYVIGRNH